MSRGMENLPYRYKLIKLGCLARGREGCMEISQDLPVSEGACREAGEGLLVRNSSDRTRGNGHRLKEGKFR